MALKTIGLKVTRDPGIHFSLEAISLRRLC